MIKRELFKELLIRDNIKLPVMDQFDYMTKQATTAPLTDITRNILFNAFPLAAAGIITLGTGIGISKLIKTKNERKQKKEENEGFESVLKMYPELTEKGVDQNRMRQAYDVYMTYAPSTAKHPMVVGQMLADYGSNAAVNIATIGQLAAIEMNKAKASEKDTWIKKELQLIPSMPAMRDLQNDI